MLAVDKKLLLLANNKFDAVATAETEIFFCDLSSEENWRRGYIRENIQSIILRYSTRSECKEIEVNLMN